MFYYPEVLKKKGKFATIWLAATKAVKLSRRQVLQVNIHSSCNDVLDHVLLRVCEGAVARPLSLYLSAQLMYGLACVLSRHSGYLVDDVRSCLEKLHRAAVVARIDLVENERLRHTLPDALSVMEQSLGASDPWFGVMTFSTPVSETLHHLEFQAEVLTPPSASPISPEPPFTMRDATSLMPEGGMFAEQAELPELSPGEIQHLLSPHLRSPLAPQGMEEDDDEEVLRKDGTDEDSGAQIPSGLSLEAELEATRTRSLEILSATVPVTASPPDALEVTLAGALVPPLATPSLPSPPHRAERGESPLQLLPYSPPAPRRPRRRLIFSDEVTQIPQDAMRAQVEEAQRSLQPLLPIEPLAAHMNSVAYLFRNPASGWLEPPLRVLWERAAVPPLAAIRPALEPPAPMSPSSGYSETEMVRGQVERSLLLARTGESIESMDWESGMAAGEIHKPLVATDVASMEEAVRAEVGMEEGMEVEMEVDAEMGVASPPTPLTPGMPRPDAAGLRHDDVEEDELRRRIGELTRETGDTVMSRLIPHGSTTRSMAARVFSMCLGLAARRVIVLEQTRPFGTIVIRRGAQFQLTA